MKQLPPELRKQKERTVEDILEGERAWTYLHALKVDQEGDCWLCRFTQLRAKSRDHIEVFRSGGALHITIPTKKYEIAEVPSCDGSYLRVSSVQLRRRAWIDKLLGG